MYNYHYNKKYIYFFFKKNKLLTLIKILILLLSIKIKIIIKKANSYPSHSFPLLISHSPCLPFRRRSRRCLDRLRRPEHPLLPALGCRHRPARSCGQCAGRSSRRTSAVTRFGTSPMSRVCCRAPQRSLTTLLLRRCGRLDYFTYMLLLCG